MIQLFDRLYDQFTEVAGRFIPKAFIPQRKVVAGLLASAVTTMGIGIISDKKNDPIARDQVTKVLTSVAALVAAVQGVTAYMANNKAKRA